MLERVWTKENPHHTVGRNVNWCSHFGEQYGGSNPGHISGKDENSNLKRYMHPNVYSNTIYTSQDMEAT